MAGMVAIVILRNMRVPSYSRQLIWGSSGRAVGRVSFLSFHAMPSGNARGLLHDFLTAPFAAVWRGGSASGKPPAFPLGPRRKSNQPEAVSGGSPHPSLGFRGSIWPQPAVENSPESPPSHRDIMEAEKPAFSHNLNFRMTEALNAPQVS